MLIEIKEREEDFLNIRRHMSKKPRYNSTKQVALSL
jgi:hypothetical protein